MYRMKNAETPRFQGFAGLGKKKNKGGMTQVGDSLTPLQPMLSKQEQKAADRAEKREMKEQEKDLKKYTTEAWKDYVATIKSIDKNLRKGTLPFDTPLPQPPAYDDTLVPALSREAKSILLNRIPAARQIAQNLNLASEARSTAANYGGGYLPQPGSGNPGYGDSSRMQDIAKVLPDGTITDAVGNVIGQQPPGSPAALVATGGGGSGPGGYGYAPPPDQVPMTYDDGSPVLDEQGNQVMAPSKTKILLALGAVALVGFLAWRFMKKKGR